MLFDILPPYGLDDLVPHVANINQMLPSSFLTELIAEEEVGSPKGLEKV